MEDDEKLRNSESNTPEEHGLGKTEEKGKVLETVRVVPALGEVGVLKEEVQMIQGEEKNVHTPSPADAWGKSWC